MKSNPAVPPRKNPNVDERLIRNVLSIFFQLDARGEGLYPWLPINILIPELLGYPEWRKFNHGRGLNAYVLAKILRELGLPPTREIWRDGQKRSGYRRDDVYQMIVENFGRHEPPQRRQP